MIELFNILNKQKNKHLQIRCKNLSFFRCDTPTALIEYLEEHLDYYIVERFNVKTSIKELDAINITSSYISSFDIDLYMSEEEYEYINKNFHSSIAKYDVSPIDIEKYKLKKIKE